MNVVPLTRPAWLRAVMALLPFAVTAPVTRADTWTNLAGHFIQATLVDYANGQATLQPSNGAAMRIPLSALCAADQRRIRLQYSEPIAPAFVAASYRDAAALLDRYDRLPPGRRSPEEREKVARQAIALFDQRLAANATHRFDAAERAEVNRLRDSLR